jgi:beta-glucosidase-like glycosyl hydrolase
MSLGERIGQLLVVSIRSDFTPTDSAAFDRAARAVREFAAGGVLVFGAPDASGPVLGQPLAAASTLNRLQAMAQTPLLVAADFEFGVGMRLAGATTFPRAMAFSAAGDVAALEEAARTTAREARAIGVHLNLAPVADVNNNPRNPVINTRSFGESPAQVGLMVSAYVRALQSEGMLATLKHFPGHGDTAVDSHLGLPLIPHARARLDAVELPPFRAGIAAGAAAVMTSHISLPAIDAAPATFSPAVVTLLRDDLGFDGLVITDSLSMAGLAQVAIPREAVVRAFLAGHDLLLDVPDVEDAFFAIAAAVDRGEISLDRIDQSVRRILRAKARLGLHENRRVALDAVADRVGSRPAAASAAAVAARAVTLLRDEATTLPLRVASGDPVLLLTVLDYQGGWGSQAPGSAMAAALRARGLQVRRIDLSDRSTDADIAAAVAAVAQHRAVVAGVFVRTMSGSGRMDLPAPAAAAMEQVAAAAAAAGLPMATALLGNPYAAASLEAVPMLALTYDWAPLAERSAVAALFSEETPPGRPPVTLGR